MLSIRDQLPDGRQTGNRLLGSIGVFILCVNLWRYFHLMGSPILTLWGHGQSKSLFLEPRHSHVMRQPTKGKEGGRKELMVGFLWRIEPGRDGEARAKRLLTLVMNGLQGES
jgi:hypothetical protein